MAIRLPSDEVPPLDALASKVPAKPAPASPEADAARADPAKPAAEPERPRAPTTLGALEVKIDVGPALPVTSTEVSEDAKTGDFARATTGEAKATALYAPAVSTLIDRLEEPEVAVAVDPVLAKLRLHLPHLQAMQADLRAHLDPEDGLRAGILARAEQAVAEAHAMIEALPSPAKADPAAPDDPDTATDTATADADAPSELEAARAALLEATLELQRVIASCPPPAVLPPAPAPVKAKEPPAPVATARQARALDEELRQSRRRLVTLGVLVGLLAAGRLALLLQEGRSTVATLEERAEQGRVETINRRAGATADQLEGGIPSVLEVRLEQQKDGSLRARAVAIDPDGDRVTLTYRWLENDQQVELEGRGTLGAYRVRAGARYRVEARASDGKHESEPMRSPVIVAGAAATGARP